ncbi:MAG: N-acetylglutaminylglutamine amidotransferase [Alphaproteobacteria bacterium]|nr:N-acetylglutaminylglutamine amidotransferase [Alphaproteobacteria bacterium]MBU0802032.1 N-acetylglutaminylglutamine amidotransferase [Alphaproteobacteria bacterium]MBU0872361.1 N-acetylglutaminylglutamine amidotransferase [Alphaproteobacteria bacterium]MBU1399531.1 N-acetylglutaminylglutamine amidotransferase [Alphaproteobacteria bacterium]MBU1589917.1 N-acetylglutaminylglutamine amidotransferase [Alphaproteobacteria bacterium]
MCGICGEVTFDGSTPSVLAISRMSDTLAPRGPDDSGIVSYGNAGFGHRRLRIIDLSEKARQPMVDGMLGLTIAFNGCIYNYPELRRELEAAGYSFFSNGDTEVILKAWHAWGEACVERFNGMFAFVIQERDSGRIIVARDRFGIKPLYLSQSGKRLRFASSLPALLKAGDVDTSIDRVALHHYMSFHAVVPPPRTIINGVKKLPPATMRIIEADGQFEDRRYWDPPFGRAADESTMSATDWRDRLLEELRAAVKRRMVADVPVGVLLSGGVDSSLIVGLLAEAGQTELMSFSVGFEEANGEKGDEFVYSDLIAKEFGTDHHKIFVPSAGLMDALPGTFQAMSEPMVSYDNVGFYLLSKEVSKHIKVVQSGQGADEVFGGYHWYPPLADSNDVVGDYARVFFDRNHETLRRQLGADWTDDRDYSRELVAHELQRPGADTPVDRALRLDSTVMLVDDPVKRVDNMTMAWGLEARVPFLDHELVELAARIPPELKLKDNGKGILKDVARMVIPSEVIDRKKGYFPVPQLKYVDGPYLDMVRDALQTRTARERGLFREDYLAQLFEAPSQHITPLQGSELWQVGLLEMWLQTHGI